MKSLEAVCTVFMLCTLLHRLVYAQNSCTTPDRKPGVCLEIGRCPSLSSLLQQVKQKTARPNALNFLRQSLNGCPRAGNTVTICCPQQAPTPSSCTPPRSPAAGSLAGGSSSADVCGVSPVTDRIVFGVDAKLFAWPWVVMLRGINLEGREVSSACTGVLISQRYVLTAAHCLKTDVRITTVRIGEHRLATNPDRNEFGQCSRPYEDVPIEQAIEHPQYSRGCRLCNDLALLRLSRNIPFDPFHAVPVCLPQNPEQELGISINSLETSGFQPFVVGWGRINNQFQPAAVLQQARVPFTQNQACESHRAAHPRGSILCAGGRGADVCRGDSGGPLLLPNASGSKWYVVGITSFGPDICGTPNVPGAFVSVNHYLPWIRSNLRP